MTTRSSTRNQSRSRLASPRSHRALPAAAQAPLEREHLATSFLVRGCERALYDLRCSLGEAKQPHDVRVGLEAVEFIEEVLSSWRETLSALDARTASAARDNRRSQPALPTAERA